MFAANDPINQNVNVNFVAEDKFTSIANVVVNTIQKIQTGTFAANISLGVLNKTLLKNNETLEKITKTATGLGNILDKTIVPQALIKSLAQIGDGLSKVKEQVNQIELGLKAMASSGYSTQIIEDFKELGNILDANAIEKFTLQAVSAYNQFAKAKSEVEVLFAPGEEFVQKLSGNIQKLVNDDLKNAITSIEALSASYQAASALFLDAGENAAVMNAGLKLAKSGGADTAATMKVLTQTIRAYNLSAGDANKVAAALNETIKLGITSLPELANGFAQTAVVAKEAGIKLEELGGAVAALTLKGSSTPSALTGIESLSRVIINKTPEATKALAQLRDEANKPIKFDVTEIKTKGLTKALQDLNKATNGNAQLLAEIIPESLAYSTALGLMSNNAEQLGKNSDKIKDVIQTGSAARKALDEVFGIKLNNQAEKFEAIINRVTESFIQLGEQIAPFVDVGVKALEGSVKFLTSLSNQQKEFIANFIAGMITVKTGVGIFETLFKTVLNVTGTFVGARLTLLLFQGQLGKTIDTISGLIKTKAGLIPIVKQLIGLDQSHLLLEKQTLEVNKSKLQIFGEILKGDGDRVKSLQELVGWNKDYIITEKDAISNAEKRKKLLDNEIDKNKIISKSIKDVGETEKQLNNIREEGLKLSKDLETNYKKQISLEEELTQAKKYKTDNPQNLVVDQDILDLQRQKVELLKQEEILKSKVSQNETNITNKTLDLNKQQLELEEKRQKVRMALNPINEKKLQIGQLELAQLTLQNRATKLANEAEELRTLSKAKGANATLLLNTAEQKEIASKSLNGKVTRLNNMLEQERITLRKMSVIATYELAVAEGTHIKTQTLLGATYVKNNLLNKILYFDLGTLIPKAGTVAGKVLSYNFGLLIPKALTLATGGVKAFTGVLTTGMTLGIGLVKGLTASIQQLWISVQPFLAKIYPFLLLAAPALAILNDQLRGMGKTIREINNTYKESNIQLLKDLEKINTNNKDINNLQRERLNLLKKEAESVVGVQGHYEGFWNNMIKGAKDFTRYMFSYDENDVLGDPIGAMFENFDFDRVQGALTNLRTQAALTRKEINFLDKDIKNFKQGLTGLTDIDKDIKEGKSLNTDQLTAVNKAFEVEKKRIEAVIKLNEDNIENLNNQLKTYDEILINEKKKWTEEEQKAYEKLTVEEKRKFDEKILEQKGTLAENALAQRRKELEDTNSLLKEKLTEQQDIIKANQNWLVNRNTIIKNIQDNTIKEEDKQFGVNATEIRLRKSLESSKADFDKYTKYIIAGIDGTGTIIEDGVAKTIDVSKDIGEEAYRKLEESVAAQVENINQLYEFGSISAEEAQKRIDELLNSQRKGTFDYVTNIATILKNENLLNYLDQQKEYVTKANKEIQDKLTYQSELYQKQLNNNLISVEEAGEKTRALQMQQLDEQEKALEKQLELAIKQGSKYQQELIGRQLDLLNQDRFALETKNLIEGKNETLKIEQSKNEDLLKLNEIYMSARIGNQSELFRVISDLELKQFENTKKQLENQLEVIKNIEGVDPKKVEELERKLTIITAQESAKRIELANKEIDLRYSKQSKALSKEIAETELLREQYKLGEEETLRDLEIKQKESIIIKQKEVKEKIALARKNKQDTVELETELVNLQLSYQQIITKSLEREYQKRIKNINLQTQAETQEYQKILNTLSSTNSSLQEEEKIINSRNSLLRSEMQFEESRLQLQLKLTTDIEKRADLELRSAELKQKSLMEEQEMEKQSFLFQQKIIDLGLQRQQIELNIKNIQLQSNAKLLELELQKAQNQKVSAEEIKTIELRLQANREEQRVLQSSQTLLNKNRINQEEITENNLKQLEMKQTIAKEGGLLDLELAKQDKILATYDKQIQKEQFNLQVVEETSNRRLATIDNVNKLEERRLNILNKQLEAEENNNSNVQKRFSILIDLEKSENKKRRLAEMAAKQELLALENKQKIEKSILEMQIKQNMNAIARQKIEQQVAELRLEAELKIAQAEAQKVLADKTKSQEEKDAAQLNVQARSFALDAQRYQRFFLDQREKDAEVESQIQRFNLSDKQRNEQLDKSLAYARTTRTRNDDNFIRNMLRQELSPYMDKSRIGIDSNMFRSERYPLSYQRSNIPQFEEFLKNKTEMPEISVKPNTDYSNNIVNYNKANNLKSPVDNKESKNIVINFNNTNDIKITSDNPTRDLGVEIEKTTYQSLYNVFRKINTDLGNF